MPINFNDLDKVTFDGTVYNEVTKTSDNTLAITQDNSNVTYDNFLLHSSKEWLSTLENNATELIKGAKDTTAKIKGDNKVLAAVKKAAPDGQPYKDVEKKLSEGAGQLAKSVAAAVDVTKYSGAINFISSTAINHLTGAYNLVADMNVDIKGPAITTTSNVKTDLAANIFTISDNDFTKTENHTRISTNDLNSTTNKHTVATAGVSITSTDNKTSAVNSHQVITSEQKQYSKVLTTLTSESITMASKGSTSINSNTVTISSGQSPKQGASQASTDITEAALGTSGSIKILSTGSVDLQATGIIATQGNTVATNASKIGFACIDFACNSDTTTIYSKIQSSVISDGITYTGNRNMGISINPFGMLVGSGVAPFIPLLTEVLPPIIVDVPELPEFPFGSLTDFLSKCLPFTSAIDLSSIATNPTGSVINDENSPTEIIDTDPTTPSTSGVDLLPLDTSFDPTAQSRGNIEQPIDLSKQSENNVNEPSNVTGITSQQTGRDIDKTPNQNTSGVEKPPLTPKLAVTIAAALGIAHNVYLDRPEDKLNNKTTPTLSTSDIASITPQLTLTESLKSLASIQKPELINSFTQANRDLISTNYTEFLKAIATIEVFGSEVSPNYSKIVNDFLSNKQLVPEIKTFLNTKRPIGVGGQQPPNIQNYNISLNVESPNIGVINTPPVIGQALIDLVTYNAQQSQTSLSTFNATTSNWFNPQQITEFQQSDIKFGEDLLNNSNLGSISSLLNNKYIDIAKGFIPDNKLQSALSLTQDIAAGKITTPQQYAIKLAELVGGDVSGYISYAEQAFTLYEQVQSGNYTSLLNIPGVSNVLGSKGTAIASKVLGLISKKNITDKDIYDVAGSIFTALTGIGIPLLDELAKLLGCIDSIKEQQPFLQSISNPDLQDIIDYLPRIIQTTNTNTNTNTNTTTNTGSNTATKILNITPNNCAQISELTAEEATINVTEVGPSYIKFKLDDKELIQYNNKPLPTIGTSVNVYTEFYTDRVNNKVLTPYKQGSQFTSNVIEYKITDNTSNIYTAILINNSTILTLEDNISGSLYAYTSADIGNRLAPYILDSYILL